MWRPERSSLTAAPEVSSRSPAAPLSEMVRMPASNGISRGGVSSQIGGENIAYALDNTHADGMLWGEVGRSGGFSWFFFSLTPAGNEQAHISTAVPACRRVHGRYGLSGHIRTYGGRPRPGGYSGPLPPP